MSESITMLAHFNTPLLRFALEVAHYGLECRMPCLNLEKKKRIMCLLPSSNAKSAVVPLTKYVTVGRKDSSKIVKPPFLSLLTD